MIELSDLDALLASSPLAKIQIIDLKKVGKNGMRTALTGQPREMSVKLARQVMFFTRPGAGKYGQRKDDRQAGSFMFYDDYISGNDEKSTATRIINIDKNSLSDPLLFKDPEVLKAMKEAGIIPSQEPTKSDELTAEQMLAKLKEMGAVSGSVKLKGFESNDLDNQ